MMNPRKQKSQRALITQMPEDYMRVVQESSPTLPLKSLHKASKKGAKSDLAQLYRQQDRSMSSAQIESSVAKEYRALRRKYLLLEEESGNLGNELREVEDEIKALEDEKLQLLDQLVVLEGLVDPAELHNQ